MQPVGDLVEFGEPGRHAARQTATGGDRVDLVHGGLQQRLEGDEVLGVTPLGDVVDLGLGAVDDLVDVGALGAGVAVLHHPGAGLDQPAQQRLLGDDARVVARVGGGGHGGDQGVHVRRTADAAQQPAAVEFGRDGDRVGRLAAAVEIQDRVVDVLVGRPVEVARPQAFQHVGDGVLAEQHPAEHGLLGGEVLGRLTTELLGRRRRVSRRLSEVVDHRHRATPPPCSDQLEQSNTDSIHQVSRYVRAPTRWTVPGTRTVPEGTLDVAGTRTNRRCSSTC